MVLIYMRERVARIQKRDIHLTSYGQRVMLHLFAAQKFVEAVTEAHTHLQKTAGTRSDIPQT